MFNEGTQPLFENAYFTFFFLQNLKKRVFTFSWNDMSKT